MKKTAGPHGRELIAFVIRDTGRGIAREDQDRIFEVFTQADGSHTRVFGGSGLGLPLARRLAKLLGGTIELSHSELNVGSTFVITIDPGMLGHVRLQSRPPQKAALHHGTDPRIGLNSHYHIAKAVPPPLFLR